MSNAAAVAPSPLLLRAFSTGACVGGCKGGGAFGGTDGAGGVGGVGEDGALLPLPFPTPSPLNLSSRRALRSETVKARGDWLSRS